MGEPPHHGPELIYKTLKKVHIRRGWLQTAYSQQRSHAENRRRNLEFEEGDKVYLKISQMKGCLDSARKVN